MFLISQTPFIISLLAGIGHADGQVQISASIPLFPSSAQVYKLDAGPSPVQALDGLLVSSAAPRLADTQNSSSEDRDTLSNSRAVFDKKSMDSAVVPDIRKLLDISRHNDGITADRAKSVAQAVLNDPNIVPKDSTSVKLADPILVSAASAKPTEDRKHSQIIEEPKVRFALVPLIRTIDGFQISGPGSRLVLTIADDGTVQGALRKWKTVSPYKALQDELTEDQVKSEINRQLSPLTRVYAKVEVNHISRAYFDTNKGYLQPVYQYSATLTAKEDSVQIDEPLIGYVAAGKTYEKIPDLAEDRELNLPADPNTTPPTFSQDEESGKHPLAIGVYINRNFSMIDMADDLLAGFDARRSPDDQKKSHFFLAQNYQAYPNQVEGTTSHDFLNSVDIAYTEPHGGWWGCTTQGRGGDAWNIHNIDPGFGSATGGRLKTWIVDACDVIPSAYDMANNQSSTVSYKTPDGQRVKQPIAKEASAAFDPWWPVFQGLHSVLGFRTSMILHDHKNTDLAALLGRGTDENMAFFLTVASDPIYYNSKTHLSKSINQQVRLGRASTFTDERDLGHSVLWLRKHGRAEVLWNFWMGD